MQYICVRACARACVYVCVCVCVRCVHMTPTLAVLLLHMQGG